MSGYSAHQSSSASSSTSSSKAITGYLMDEDLTLTVGLLKSLSNNTRISEMFEPLLGPLQAHVKRRLPGVDLNSKEFKHRPVDLTVWLGTNFKAGEGDPTLSALQPDMNRILFAFHSAVPIARQFISDKKMEILNAELAATKISSGSKDKGKESSDDIITLKQKLATSNQKLRDSDTYARKVDAEKEEKDRIIARLTQEIERQRRTNHGNQEVLGYRQNEIARLTKVTRALHVRILLDQARERLKDNGDISRDVKPTSRPEVLAHIVTQVKSRLLARGERLSDEAIRAIFDSRPRTLRAPGNQAAHIAPDDDISTAVLDSSHPPAERAILRSLFIWVQDGQEP